MYDRVKIEAKVGMESLIGVGKERPSSWGNYFWFRSGERCLNMWAENLETAVERFLDDGMVECAVWDVPSSDSRGFSSFAIVIDRRIPQNWLYQKLCFTGGYGVDLATATEMYELVGDPDNELERWSDPVSYYDKRGMKYNPATGIISCEIKAQSRPLNAKWTVEAAQTVMIDGSSAEELLNQEIK